MNVSMLHTLALAAAHAAEHGNSHEIDWYHFGGQWFTFLFFLGGLYYYGKKPIAAFFLKRHEDVKKAITEAQQAKAEAEAKAKEYAAKMADLETEMKKLKESFAGTAEAEKARMIAEAEALAKRIQKDTDLVIQTELQKAQDQLRTEAAEMAVEMAEGILRREIKAEDQKRLVDDFMKTLSQRGLKQEAA